MPEIIIVLLHGLPGFAIGSLDDVQVPGLEVPVAASQGRSADNPSLVGCKAVAFIRYDL